MTLHLELTDEQGRLILESASRQDEATLRRLLGQAFEATIQRLLFQEPRPLEAEPFEKLSRRLSASFTASPDHRSLPPEALTREALYDNHE
jgi:hypothetical protein